MIGLLSYIIAISIEHPELSIPGTAIFSIGCISALMPAKAMQVLLLLNNTHWKMLPKVRIVEYFGMANVKETSNILRGLKKEGLIVLDTENDLDYIHITERGREKAQDWLDKHSFIATVFHLLKEYEANNGSIWADDPERQTQLNMKGNHYEKVASRNLFIFLSLNNI